VSGGEGAPERSAELRDRINRYPPYVGAEIRLTHLAPDASEIRVEMPLTERNVSLVGVHFGGSLYAMVDPHLMILLVERLGPEYVVWDRRATIDFVRPGRGTVRATVRVTDEEVAAIVAATADGEKHLPRWTLEITDEDGAVVATVEKTLYVRRRPEA
jgi:acyl-coenzyme A thioesterase PaaI-like protein